MTRDRGVALVITLIAISVLSALGLGLLLTAAAERSTATNYRDAVQALNAAEAALELAARELGRLADWNTVLSGAERSRFVDGPPAGIHTAGGITVDLSTATDQLTCGRAGGCTDAQRRTSTAERPWGGNNPRWQPFLYGSMAAFAHLPRVVGDAYVIVWVGDDAREVDDDPLTDGSGPNGEGRDMIRVRAEAFSSGGTRRAVEADVIRKTEGIRVQSWRVRTSGLP